MIAIRRSGLIDADTRRLMGLIGEGRIVPGSGGIRHFSSKLRELMEVKLDGEMKAVVATVISRVRARYLQDPDGEIGFVSMSFGPPKKDGYEGRLINEHELELRDAVAATGTDDTMRAVALTDALELVVQLPPDLRMVVSSEMRGGPLWVSVTLRGAW